MDTILDKYDLKQFYKDLGELHIVLTDSQVQQFLIYYEMLIEKNKVMNLTAITEFNEVLKKHFIDSLSLVKAYDRIDFLGEVIEELALDGIDAIHGRAEDYAKPGQLREQYDLCVSRAVANLSVLSEYCLPYVKVGGKFISYKSEKITEEMKNAEYAIKTLGGKIEEQIAFNLPDSDLFRNLFVVEKCVPTPVKYPRKAGMASKKPL